MSAKQNKQKQIAEAFIKEMEKFKRGGYQFNHSGKALFEGTQREAFNAYLKGIKDGHQKGYFEIPTGVGKTALFIAIIGCYLRATENIPDAPRVLIHEPTTDLLVQTARAFADFMPEIAKSMEADDTSGKEIDWANSDVDIHYGNRKGTKNTPKVLITTYQSQTADERKDNGTKKDFDPEHFGLVIHDEAHYLTGEKYGPAAVDKFHGAIQLGVTATPEYSEHKTVAEKLAHHYYHLPLNTAIERGDLCHVCPIVLKTHLKDKDKIDLKKAQQFFAQRNGRALSHGQLEVLLNQEARNQAIIKSYLAGEHPDTGERFLGQTGMIFAGGIRHCGDFIRHANNVLDKPAYRAVKKWLKDEGLCLIAPIHSEVPKDGVEITIGGKRKRCTPEEIKELHRRGKILLLISDQQLKLGTDFPMDSFVADIVDRFSVVDATQRMGRGFRVDRGNAHYGLPANPDKSCAAINVIDETTHEMYKGTPHHPIHTIEILHGAEFRPPGRKKSALIRFKDHPPEVSETLEQLGFEFITRTDVIWNVQKKLKTKKEEGVWTIRQLAEAVGVTPGAISQQMEKLHAQLAQKEVENIDFYGLRMPRKALTTYMAFGRRTKTVKSPWAEQLIQKYMELRTFDGVWSITMFAQELETSPAMAGKIIENLQNQFATNSRKPAKYLGIKIPYDALVEYNAQGRRPIGIKQEWGRRITEAYKINREKRSEALSTVQIANELGLNPSSCTELLQNLVAQFSSHKIRSAKYRELEIPKDAFVEVRKNAIGIKLEWGERLIEEYKKKTDKPKDVINDKELSKLTGTTSRIINTLYKAMGDRESIDYKGITIPRPAFVEYNSNTGKTIGLNKEYAKKIVSVYIPRADVSKKLGYKSPPITRKNIRPGGEALKRTGRVRARDDE